MNKREPRYGAEEFSRRGQDIYDNVVRAALRPEDDGRFVAIDIESGDYAINVSDVGAGDELLARRPDAQIWLMRAGRKGAYNFGYVPLPGERR